MEKFKVNKAKPKYKSREELLELSKEELVNEIIRLERHNIQLRNIISKSGVSEASDIKYTPKRKFDFAKHSTRHVLLQVAYLGWSYQGLTTQEDTNQTIENYLFSALTRACLIESRETSDYHRCGRTDKGVSAFGQIISITLRSKLKKDQQTSVENELEYCKMLNRLLPEDIRVIRWMPVPDELSARFDCKRRLYKYYFPQGDLDVQQMQKSCEYLVGNHDFRNLCKMDVGNGVTCFNRELVSAEIRQIGSANGAYTMYYLEIIGNAFLWHQIRCIVGVLLLIGQRKEEPEIIKELLDVEKNPRKPQYAMALDTPLNLFECFYDTENEWVYDKDECEIVMKNFQKLWTLHSVKTTMIKDILDTLENDNFAKVYSQTECLLEGIKSKIYKTLLKRDTCSSLEERIEHFEKKRRIIKDDIEDSSK